MLADGEEANEACENDTDDGQDRHETLAASGEPVVEPGGDFQSVIGSGSTTAFPSVALRPWPGHGELVAAPHIFVAVEGEPERGDDIEHHHGHELCSVSQEYREVSDCAKQEQHIRG